MIKTRLGSALFALFIAATFFVSFAATDATTLTTTGTAAVKDKVAADTDKPADTVAGTDAVAREHGTKLLLVGWDAATWDVMLPLVKDGRMPNVKKLMESGAYGDLKTYTPTASPLIWTTMATGKSPVEHGITGFLYKERNQYEPSVMKSGQRRVKALWNILSDRGHKNGFVGWWATWPAEKVDGEMVTDTLDIADYKDRVYPQTDEAEFEALVPEKKPEDLSRYLGRPVDKAYLDDLQKNEPDAARNISVLQTYIVKDRASEAVALNLLRREKFDVFSVYFQGIDPVQHYFWKYMRPEGFGPIPGNHEGMSDVIARYYEEYDAGLGRLMDEAGKDAVVIVVSDHGMKGMIPDNLGDFSTKNMIVREDGEYALRSMNLDKVLSAAGFLSFGPDGKPDWSNTLAYSWSAYLYYSERTVCLNLKDREPQGVVEPEAAQILSEEVVRTLGAIKSTDGKPLFTPCAISGEDISCAINPKIGQNDSFLIGDKLYTYIDLSGKPSHLSAIHGDEPPGIFIAAGPGIKKSVLKGASVYDIAPTVLALSGLPVAKDMRGGPLKIFKNYPKLKKIKTYEDVSAESAPERTAPRKVQAKPVRRIIKPVEPKPVPVPKPQTPKPVKKPKNSASEKELKERLRSLGYIQ